MALTMMQKMAEMRGKPPEEAKFFWSGGPVELAERTWFNSLFSGTVAFDTDEGIVLVDSGLVQLGPTLAGMLRQKTQAPIHTAIFTQGHVDHAYGLEAFLVAGQPAPRIIAHRAMPRRFARYARTAGHNAALNARQFGGTVAVAEEKPDQFKSFGSGYPALQPNLLYDERIDIVVGGVTFEIHHCPGETDDHSWIFCPERGVLCPGDLFIWGVPNSGNPQKVQRFPSEWAAGLRKMAAREPRSLGPGHGGPVVDDPALIRRMLLETADYLDSIVEQTIAAMNKGSPPHTDIVHQVALPKTDSPWLQAVYDEGEFIVRNVMRLYGGWWNGRPGDLKPAPREKLAQEIAGLAGGAVALAERARTVADGGDMRLACQLADYAVEASPGDAKVQEIAAALYDRREGEETSLMAKNIMSSAAAYIRQGRPFR